MTEGRVLTCLRVRNLAIIEELELPLGPGLNVLTGETGAGKSILVGALTLVLGGRGSPTWVRTGAEQAEVEALFDVSDDAPARARLAELDLDGDEELVVRRVLGAGGRSRAYVNGRLATAAQLRGLAAGLVDISSQHAHHTLVDPATHLDLLDGFATLAGPRADVAAAHDAAVQAAEALSSLRARARDRGDRVDLLRLQLREMREVDPQPDEDAEIERELEVLRHADALERGAHDVAASLLTNDRSACEVLASVAHSLSQMSRHDPSLEGLANRVDASRIELEDVARDVGRYAERIVSNPARLAHLEERRVGLRQLARRHGGTLEAALAWRAEAEAELDGLDDLDGALERAETAQVRALVLATEVARRLSVGRHAGAERLGEAISGELGDLGMGGAQVRVDVAPLEGSGLRVGEARLSRTGIDRVEFFIAPNPGEEPRPLARVASGGELSRALLALKRVLASQGPVGSYVFDEVDTGVGGAVADAIGRKLAEVARHHQVLCITHLPQVAVWGGRHLRIAKEVRQGRTHAVVEALHGSGRVEEIARMMGGATVTDATRRAARELLGQAG